MISPRSVRRLASGALIFDFGQNISGWNRLKVAGPTGTEVRLRHAELLNEDGTLNCGPNENAEATDVYILRGGGTEVYEPRFTYHGFRYVEMTGYPGEPGPDALEALCVGDAGKLVVTSTPNQDNPIADGLVPILQRARQPDPRERDPGPAFQPDEHPDRLSPAGREARLAR